MLNTNTLCEGKKIIKGDGTGNYHSSLGVLVTKILSKNFRNQKHCSLTNQCALYK